MESKEMTEERMESRGRRQSYKKEMHNRMKYDPGKNVGKEIEYGRNCNQLEREKNKS